MAHYLKFRERLEKGAARAAEREEAIKQQPGFKNEVSQYFWEIALA